VTASISQSARIGHFDALIGLPSRTQTAYPETFAPVVLRTGEQDAILAT